ncbi:MAG: calycin-like domain-containing protein [Muribaculaceae bacterium]|nr:calycin-like domain-containing protein [Muribaculaceae bacterium]MDE6093673.1 calycin-like domain-containing protein [Muribaculaceae bacterium]
MKSIKTIFATMAVCLGIMTTATACSDDKDEPAVPAAKSVAGTYTSDMTCSVMGQESTFENMTFTLTSTDDATVTLDMSAFGNPPMQVPAIKITGIKVSGENGKYTLAPTDFNGTTTDGKAYSGKIQGSFADKCLTMQFNLQYGAMPMPMICSFTAQGK